MMWLLLLLHIAHIGQVIVQAPAKTYENRLILRNENKACEGFIEIYHNNRLGYVGDKHWDENTEKVVCESTHCGKRVSSTDVERPNDGPVWLNEVNCTGTEGHLLDCQYPGWNISFYSKEYVKKIKCSNDIKFSLVGFKCAGAVQFTINNIHSGYFCEDNWEKEQADLLCESLGCGTGEIPTYQFMLLETFASSKKMTIKCSGIQNVTNLWQCVTQESSSCRNPASVICAGHERLQLKGNDSNACSGQLEKEKNGKWNPVKKSGKGKNVKEIRNLTDDWCRQMYCGISVSHNLRDNNIQLNCTDNVTVDLRDKRQPSKCYGTVHINRNDSAYPVCAQTWTDENAQVVCRELNCGNVIDKGTNEGKEGIMDSVSCTGSESSLWHCKAKRHKTTFKCQNHANVVCAGSVKVRLADGLGDCAGRVEILYGGRWQLVAKEGWTEINSDVVCRELGCGKKRFSHDPEKFSQGSGAFLDRDVICDLSASKISECIKAKKQLNNRGQITEAIGITCEEHKVVFLNKSCSGAVGIAKGNETYWLSGSNETWNRESANAVCQQMHCGDASSFNYTRANMMNVWKESYSCSSSNNSLFQCGKTTQPSNHSETIATVKCSGRIQVNLTNTCWGNVNVCVDGKCGGVCADAWTPQKSEMLCENLGCGKRILPTYLPATDNRPLIAKSLHTTEHTTNLSQCNFVKYDKNDKLCNKGPTSVICSGSIKPRIKAFRDKCSGNVEVYYGGQWLPVWKDALNDTKTRETICKELKCGPAPNKIIDYFGPVSAFHAISQIQCATSSESLTACNIPSAPQTSPSRLGGIQCSSWSKMELINSKTTCSGDVIIRSEGKKSAVSIEGWTETEGELLCRELQCGNLKSIKTIMSDSLLSRSFNCTGVENPESIWPCEKQTSPSQKQLSIECEDEANVTLSNHCHGEVRINDIRLCDTNWSPKFSHMVCQEQDCSNAITTTFDNAKPNEEYYHVSCENYEDKLGRCKRFKGKCDGQLVSVYCVGNVKFNTTEKCGGQIEVNYRNKWEKVCSPAPLPSKFMEMLCVNLKCGLSGTISATKKILKGIETKLLFTGDYNDIKHSVEQDSCDSRPAEIYCEGYERKAPPPPPQQTRIVPIILGVGVLLVLVILIVVFIRICIVKRAKNAMNVTQSRMSRKEIEFESGDYEDVTSKSNEMEDFSRDRFRSEAEAITESDARSTSSFPYDDIDEAAEARPLTSRAATAAGDSEDNYIDKAALDQSADGVTYEVDDPQENYDDIEASPEITQTTADVHDSPQTTPKSVAAAPPGLVQGDEDYLVPGQDG